MRGDAHGEAHSPREYLSTGWEFCCTRPGAWSVPGDVAEADWRSATVPCTAASALRDLGSWSLDATPRRFDAEDWWFRLRFARPEGAHGPLVLGFDGLASVADVWLNDSQILTSDNMFLRHECAVEQVLASDNRLYICFRSLDALLARKRPRPRWRAPMIEHQQLRWHRTTLLGRTPGWSPPAAVVGPWQPVWLEQSGAPRIHEVALRSRVLDERGLVELRCSASGFASDAQFVLVVSGTGGRHSTSPFVTDGSGQITAQLTVADPEFWWPHTHGTPYLYDATLLVVEGTSTRRELPLGRVGFRTVELNTEAGDFSLSVNGVPVFCRGACWTPLDVATLRSESRAYAETLQQVQDGGMNMLRVGGTMVYETDAFYAQCDELGILVWQDFMFANMDYPGDDPSFRASVEREARQSLLHIGSHPCISVLCGNSEVEQQAAMWGAPRSAWQPELFHALLAGLAAELCPAVPYWPSSAHGGSFPHQPSSGTTSYYGVGAYLRPLEDARRTELRFATECLAFANVPETATLQQIPGGTSLRVHHPAWKARSPRDVGAGWDFDDVRDHYLKDFFVVEPMQLRYADHPRYLALSRLASSEAMAAAFGEWRRARNTCKGALVWFLRDLWPGAGWGVIGSDGLPKAAYHYLRRAFQPQSLHISDEGLNGLTINITNELEAELTGTLELRLLRNGEVPIVQEAKQVTVPSRGSLELSASELLEGFHDLAYAHRFGPPAFDVAIATLRTGAESNLQLPLEGWYFRRGFAAGEPGDVGLQAQAIEQDDGSLQLRLSTRTVARGVCIDVQGYLPDDQYFNLAPGAERVVKLRVVSKPAVALRGTAVAVNSRVAAQIKFL